jgi:hypothetical protein
MCMPLSIISLLDREEYREKMTVLPKATDKRYHMKLYRVPRSMSEIWIVFLVVIGTHCKGSYKSNYHTITTMTNCGFLRYYTLHHPFIVYFTLSNIKECYIFISIGLCDPNPCHNGGVCHQSGDSYACTCSGDYYGEKCNGMYHYYCIISLRDEVCLYQPRKVSGRVFVWWGYQFGSLYDFYIIFLNFPPMLDFTVFITVLCHFGDVICGGVKCQMIKWLVFTFSSWNNVRLRWTYNEAVF